jgi:hypothetical protein
MTLKCAGTAISAGVPKSAMVSRKATMAPAKIDGRKEYDS